MSGVRRPVVVGLAAGDGASTLAAALHARDGGRLDERAAAAADIVVCRQASLHRAARLACAPDRPRPLLAVTLGPGEPEQEPVRDVHHALQRHFEAVVALPHVARWHGIADARDDAAVVLAQPPHQLARSLRAHAAALHTLVAALVGSGLLARPVPPLLTGPGTDLPPPTPDPVTRPGGRATPFHPVLIAAPHPIVPLPVPRPTPDQEPDDDTLEAETAGAAAGRAG